MATAQGTRQQAGSSMRPRLPARAPQRRQRRWRRRCARAEQRSTRIDGRMQCRERTEQLHAAPDFQQQALGGSMLTNGVNRCACRPRRCSGACRAAGSVSAGNTTAYHSCLDSAAGCGVRRRAAARPARAGMARPQAPATAAEQIRRARRGATAISCGSRECDRAGPPALDLDQFEMGRARPRVISRRRLAGEDSNRWRSGRNSTPSAPPPRPPASGAAASDHRCPSATAAPRRRRPNSSACSAAHSASVAVVGRTTSRRSSSMPC